MKNGYGVFLFSFEMMKIFKIGQDVVVIDALQ